MLTVAIIILIAGALLFLIAYLCIKWVGKVKPGKSINPSQWHNHSEKPFNPYKH